jgi:hypothetical protein
VTIGYILNEDATAGVRVDILSGTTVIRSLEIASGSEGARRGTNSVVWDGKNSSGAVPGAGVFSVSVTAASTGFENWTQISDDGDTNTYVYSPRGIAVNRNTNSPYYGRVFIGNSTAGPNAGSGEIGHVQGILMRNADGSHTDDGAFGQAGYAWVDAFASSPIHLKVKEDDQLYFNDWTGSGKIVACDMKLTTNYVVLDESNYSANPFASANWINFEVTGAGTDLQQVYLTDATYPSAGVFVWNTVLDQAGRRIADPNDHAGRQVVATGTGASLSLRCDGVAIDSQTNVYVIQNRGNPSDSSMRVAKFSNWDGTSVLNSGASWVVGQGDDTFRNLYGFALDSEENPKILACPMSAAGTVGANNLVGGGIRLMDAATGAPIYSEPNPFSTHTVLPYLEPFADQSAGGGTPYAVGSPLAGQTNQFGEGWAVVNSNSTAGEPTITQDNLEYPGLPSSTGNSVLVTPAGGRSARVGLLTSTPTTAMYYSYKLKVTDTVSMLSTPANNFITAFSDSAASQAGSLARATARLVTTYIDDQTYYIGIGKGSATADYQYDPTPRKAGDVLFVVASYERVGGVTNVNLWVNPPSETFQNGTPPAPTAAITVGSAAADVNANGARAFVISCHSSTAPTAIIDDVRAGRSWSAVTGGPDINPPPQYVSNLTATVFYRSACFDHVGNLYAGSSSLERWRVFSPPGTNQATTLALASIQTGLAIHISNIAMSAGVLSIRFTAAEGTPASEFVLEHSSDLNAGYSPAQGSNISSLGAGEYEATVPASGPWGFYRIKR